MVNEQKFHVLGEPHECQGVEEEPRGVADHVEDRDGHILRDELVAVGLDQVAEILESIG